MKVDSSSESESEWEDFEGLHGFGPGTTVIQSGGETTIIPAGCSVQISGMTGLTIGANNYTVVERNGTHRARSRNHGHRKHTRSRSPPVRTDSTTPVSNSNMNHICNNIGGRWRRLGAALGETRGALEAIEYDFRTEGTYEMAWQMLLRWRRRNGSGATVGRLVKCLLEIGESELAKEMP
ncbi:RIPK1-like protein [Mya arenaria]|uniref:RIPK1-like protein n=1 Tax=Mya arenaria TaxID=6604 RepID=A0ABY7FNA1_MYAAR|nr:receptor-interacting serine/threonine-protein kinase 1-like [Mya arenaria]WAR23072.1 RIPK1-like protein [Mya arenaria]